MSQSLWNVSLSVLIFYGDLMFSTTTRFWWCNCQAYWRLINWWTLDNGWLVCFIVHVYNAASQFTNGQEMGSFRESYEGSYALGISTFLYPSLEAFWNVAHSSLYACILYNSSHAWHNLRSRLGTLANPCGLWPISGSFLHVCSTFCFRNFFPCQDVTKYIINVTWNRAYYAPVTFPNAYFADPLDIRLRLSFNILADIFRPTIGRSLTQCENRKKNNKRWHLLNRNWK